jgi:TRAP transporter TAXI family solute receptor
MHKLLKFAVASVVLLGLAGNANAVERWSVATSSTGSGPYIMGSTLAQVINGAQKKIELSAQSSGGYNANLSLVADGSSTLGLGALPDLIDAYNGTGKFASLPNKERFKNLRLLFPVALSTWHCMVRADSGIKSFSDLKGRKFNLNVPSTATRQINEGLVSALGMKQSDFKIFSISSGKTFDALQDNVIDASCNGLAVPSGEVLQLASQVPIHLLSIDDKAYTTLNARYHGALLRHTIPANTYPGQTKEAITFANQDTLYVNKDVSEDLVYAFTKAYFENLDQLQKKYSSFKGLTLQQDAALKVDFPRHPGVIRYMKEKGLLK